MIINISLAQIDAINLAGILLSVVGFFYLSYALFERKPLKWFVRIITPTLSGAFILATVGVLEIVYISSRVDPVSAEPSRVIRTGAVYACIGGFIGAFNGYFVEWPLVSKKPRCFSPKGCFMGIIFMSFICSLITFEYNLTLSRSFIEGIVLDPLGAIVGGFWPIINWTPSTYAGKAPKFSWKGCSVGLVFTFLFGFAISLVLGRSPIFSLLSASLLTPTGIIAGGLWQFLIKDSSFFKMNPSIIKSNSGLQNNIFKKVHEKRDNLITNLNDVDNNLLANLPNLEKVSLFPIDNSALIFNSLFEWEYTKEGILVQKGKVGQVSSSKESMETDKAPLFSLRGCLIGLISACMFGFIFALIVDITFGIDLMGSLRAALTAASLIGPAGALTGGISRFIFWRANSLTNDHLGRIGAGLTLLGFLLQMFPSLIGLLNLPVH